MNEVVACKMIGGWWGTRLVFNGSWNQQYNESCTHEVESRVVTECSGDWLMCILNYVHWLVECKQKNNNHKSLSFICSYNHISLKTLMLFKISRTHFNQYLASSAVLGWPRDGDCYLLHRMQSKPGLIHGWVIDGWIIEPSPVVIVQVVMTTDGCCWLISHVNNLIPMATYGGVWVEFPLLL